MSLFKKMALFSYLAAFLSFSSFAFADTNEQATESTHFEPFVLISDLRSDLNNAVKAYCEEDPNCHCCRGNERSSGIKYLEVIQNIRTHQYYLRGFLWANSLQIWKHQDITFPVYGDVYDEKKEDKNTAGLLRVQFLLPINQYENGKWVGDFENITKDVHDHAKVCETQFKLLEHIDLDNYDIPPEKKLAAYVFYFGARRNLLAPPPHIQIREIFKLVLPYLPQTQSENPNTMP